MYDSGHLLNDLRALGVKCGDTLLVHSAFRNIKAASVLTAVEALMRSVGESGTLIMPSFPGGSEFFLVQSGITFDVRTRPSDCGLITEAFRKQPGVIRSLSPTHCMAAWGKNAGFITGGHEKCRVSAGWGSPFEKIIALRGKILLIGVTNVNNTTLHYLENTNGAPTVCAVEYYPKVITPEGKLITVPTFPHMPGLPRNYGRVEVELDANNIQQHGRFGDAEARIIDAYSMSKLISGRIKSDPMYLIKRFSLDDHPAAE
ncbi:MAG: AAC(3) family N-acetyltransferase [Lentisphaerae bacterium]|nr:AAC(3) family N-acetyltransferase [Lentisphaerota bacterium]